MSADQSRFRWDDAESQFPAGWRLFVIVIETMTNHLLEKRGWRAGVPVRVSDDHGYGGPSFELGYPQTWLSRAEAESAISQYGRIFGSGVTFKVVEFVQKP